MTDTIKNRYDFVLLFDVKDGNPNGDPDAGNLPRVDSETGQGIVTDVCLKRKVRNYVQLVKGCEVPYDIYIKEKAVLGRAHFTAFFECGIDVGQEYRIAVPATIKPFFDSVDLCEGLSLEDGDDESQSLVVSADADKKIIKSWIKEEGKSIPGEVKKLITAALKESKPRKPTSDETGKGRAQMCKRFYDVRSFGAVMSLKSAPNCGQVRGPIQITFARSIDPVITLEYSITRMAVATEAEAEKQSGDNRTMGRKSTIPYGLYVAHGFVSANLAAQTGFSEADLELFWEALLQMFEHDRSAARGLMSPQKLVVFKHDSALGNKPAHELFKRVAVERIDLLKPARDFSDYKVTVDKASLEGVKIIEKL